MLCAYWRRSGYRTAVLDPLRAPDWPAYYMTADPEAFMFYVKTQTNLRIFVDEGAESLARAVDFNWLAAQSRQWGHRCHFLSQRPQDFTPAIRGNCHHLWLFGIDGSAADLLAREFNAPLLKDASKNPCLSFHYAQRFADVRRGKIDFQKRSIIWTPDNVRGKKNAVD